MVSNKNIQISNSCLEKGVEMKRLGNYMEAKNCYLTALKHHPKDSTTFINLGKISYLLGDYNLAIASFLASTHLQLNIREKKQRGLIEYPYFSKLNDETAYNSLSIECKKKLPTKSALLILQDPNTPRHISHAYNDFNIDSKEIKIYSDIYKSTLEGNKNLSFLLNKYNLNENDFYDFDNKIHLNAGINILLKLIRWDKLMSTDVLSLYF